MDTTLITLEENMSAESFDFWEEVKQLWFPVNSFENKLDKTGFND